MKTRLFADSFSIEGVINNAATPNLVTLVENSTVPAGFTNVAEDYIEKKIDLNELLLSNPTSSFIIRVRGNSMTGSGIFNNSLLIVDRSKSASKNSICLCILDGEFTVKKIRKEKSKIFLVPTNDEFKETEITPERDFEIFGVITKVIHDPQ